MKYLLCMLPIIAAAMGEEAAERQLVRGNNEFTAKLFNEVAKNEMGKSVVMSGFSALSPLAQLGLASEGASHDEILKSIGMPNDEAVKEAFSAVNRNLRSAKGIELKVANKVYIPHGRELNQTFASMSRDVFSSDVQNVDFSKNVEAAATINHWVEDNTNKRIKDLIKPDSLDGSTQAVLVNAIYFKGSWEEEFDKKMTQDRDFHVTKDKTIKVPTMYKNGNFRYGQSAELDAKLLELSYKGGEASFLIVLPNKIDGVYELQQKLLTSAHLERAVENMHDVEVDIYIPKFKIETTIDLKDVLQKIGVSKLFNAQDAKLNYLLKSENSEGLFVSDAIQKAFLEINEEGAEAAAASAYGTRIVGGEPPSFIADRPFYYELQYTTNMIFTAFSVNRISGGWAEDFLADRPFYYELRINDETVLFNGAVLQPFT